jgi:cytochrome c-type protein NapB
MQTSGFRLQASAVLTTAICLAAAMTGCGDETAGPAVAPASLVARAARRAYDGAPPVIPHKPLGSCTVCHTPTGRETPGVGFAPANPHWGSARDGALANCRQCHAFAVATDRFAHSEFRGLPQQRHDGLRPHNQAPPQIPHRTSMRENCAACHSGPAAREEIRCSHAERRNCRQCHLPRHAAELAD